MIIMSLFDEDTRMIAGNTATDIMWYQTSPDTVQATSASVHHLPTSRNEQILSTQPTTQLIQVC